MCNLKPKMKDNFCSPIKQSVVDVGCSPILFRKKLKILKSSSSSLSSSSKVLTTGSSDCSGYLPSSDENCNKNLVDYNFNVKKIIGYLTSSFSKTYLGILEDWLFLIDKLHDHTGVRPDDINL